MTSKKFFDISIILENNIQKNNDSINTNNDEWNEYIYDKFKNKIRCNYTDIIYECVYKREEKISDIEDIGKYRDIHQEKTRTLSIKLYCNNNDKYNIYINRININGDAINGLYYNKFIYFTIKKKNEIVYNFDWKDEDIDKKHIEQIYKYENFNEMDYLKSLIQKKIRNNKCYGSKYLNESKSLIEFKRKRIEIENYQDVYDIFNILEKNDEEIKNNKKDIILNILIMIMVNDKTFDEKIKGKKLEIQQNISNFEVTSLSQI